MITMVEFGANDILVVKLGVGDMPPTRVKEYAEAVKANIVEKIGITNPIIMLPARGEAMTELCVLKRV